MLALSSNHRAITMSFISVTSKSLASMTVCRTFLRSLTSASSPASPTKRQIISLYRDLIRSSRVFASHNYRDYIHRRAQDAFRKNATETDPKRIQALYERGKRDLEVARRQGWLNAQFRADKSVVDR
ncbi:uncharacterized protein SPPG_08870 [Spizellomyces punctatus DAOM BR117]|uniref:Complex 1 LYR protein domain-containing protein n=1 Tax=Spizellomyces punctatus (strain DAOM BR117) TaxID=645134 RepID=A0A0L0HVW4_SPIPD|nr:uncharacterized protein SPPG_08870 [Spizellomyces punctatus DAOM BR117]KND05040.1 hypothetical protein SPPG_08870 [Spizellomyces punctatus DAOM BR117]|eukprot:XP_016613079.1 hypothetical protein SPPG_08870 [Spizellomyces punctatus DAOM BR117]